MSNFYLKIEEILQRISFTVKPVRKYVRARTKQYRHNKESARAIITLRIEHFNSFYKHTVGDIRIRDQKTRWGSCSEKGNLNFNYKTAFLEPNLRDYVVVHELCHLKEFNHSQDFWALVALSVPDHKALRKELKKIKM
ncbi:MAG: M48 family metallopeptidase [Patescibacteria group bacterium]